jgi:hypothetical protein
MLRYKLRTLLIVLALGPPLLAGAWVASQALFAVPTPLIPKGSPSGITGPHRLPALP